METSGSNNIRHTPPPRNPAKGNGRPASAGKGRRVSSAGSQPASGDHISVAVRIRPLRFAPN